MKNLPQIQSVLKFKESSEAARQDGGSWRWPTLNPWVYLLLLVAAAGCSSVERRVPAGGSKEARARAVQARRASEAEYERNVQIYSHYAAALSHDLNGESGAALDEYWHAALADPSDEPLVMEVARRLMRAEKFSRAVELLTKAAEQPEASGSIFAWLGLAHNRAGNHERAIAANRAAIRKEPASLPAYQNLAQIYLQQNKTNDALAVLDQASEQSSVDAEFLADLAELYFRFSRVQSGTNQSVGKKALGVLDRAMELKPGNPMVQQKLAEGYFQFGELKKAEGLYLELLKNYPEMLLLRGKLAEIYLRTEQNAKAAEQLEAISRADPANPRTHSFLGAIALEENKLPEAARYFERALLLNPELEPVYYELAGVNLNLKKPKEALELLEKARAKFKANFILEFYSGAAQMVLKNYGQAVKHFTAAEALAKTDDPARLNPHFYYQLGASHERNGDYEAAERVFRKCLEMKPDFADALNYLGYMWAERGTNLEEARVMIEKAVALEPKNAAFLDSLGWVLYQLKQPKAALEYILKAIELSEEPDPTLLDHLGDVYSALKQFDQAREAWEKSLTVESNDGIRKKIESLPSAATTKTLEP